MNFKPTICTVQLDYQSAHYTGGPAPAIMMTSAHIVYLEVQNGCQPKLYLIGSRYDERFNAYLLDIGTRDVHDVLSCAIMTDTLHVGVYLRLYRSTSRKSSLTSHCRVPISRRYALNRSSHRLPF